MMTYKYYPKMSFRINLPDNIPTYSSYSGQIFRNDIKRRVALPPSFHVNLKLSRQAILLSLNKNAHKKWAFLLNM